MRTSHRLLLFGDRVAAPVYVSSTTNEAGTIVTVTFDKEMADPTGKHAQFTVNDGEANAVTAAALNGTTTKIDLTLTNAIENGDTVTVAYTAGDVTSSDTGVLETFGAESVSNTVVATSQKCNSCCFDNSNFFNGRNNNNRFFVIKCL